MNAPQNPAGIFHPEENYTDHRRNELIAEIEAAPTLLRRAVANLSEGQLNTPYINWTIRQIVHHLADSHVNSYIRFKWTLTEDHPTIKAYDENLWVALPDSAHGNIQAPLALLEGLHLSWLQLLRAIPPNQFSRSFLHPQTGNTITLAAALPYYAWHSRHHTAQITWLRNQHNW